MRARRAPVLVAVALAAAVLAPCAASASAPISCPSGLSEALLWGYVAQSGAYQEPDEEITDPPAPVAEAARQRAFATGGPEPRVVELKAAWHHVTTLHQGPLGAYLLCKYPGRPAVRITVPPDLDTCTTTPGKAYCQ